MATIDIFDKQYRPMGWARFTFSQEQTQSYLFVDIDANYAAKFQLADTTIFTLDHTPVASMMCGSNGKDIFGVVTRLHTLVVFGKIVNGYAEGLGSVMDDLIYSNRAGLVGRLSVNWSHDDEDFYARNLRVFAQHLRIPDSRFHDFIEQIRPTTYRNMMGLAGAAALITELVA